MIEHLFDEALVWSLRAGRDAMEWDDIQKAKLTEEIGLANPVEYTDEEKPHHRHPRSRVTRWWPTWWESGRKLEVLSIIRRRGSLGLLAHSDTEERFLRNRTELLSQIQISFGGMVAEELWFGESGTGPGSDLSQATHGRRHHGRCVRHGGFARELRGIGRWSLGQRPVARVLGDDKARGEVERILDRSKESVRELLDSNRHLVEALRDELLVRDELVGDEITGVLEEARLAHLIGPVE